MNGSYKNGFIKRNFFVHSIFINDIKGGKIYILSLGLENVLAI